MAYAQATGIAKAFAKAEGSVGNCDTQCSAAGKVIASSFETIFLEATAKLEPYFYGKATDEDSEVRDKYHLYTRAYEKATVEAFAAVIVKAKGEVEKCASTTFAIAGAGEKGDLNIASCKLDLTASTDEYIVDSVAKAYADAGAHTCFGRVTSEYYEVEAKVSARGPFLFLCVCHCCDRIASATSVHCLLVSALAPQAVVLSEAMLTCIWISDTSGTVETHRAKRRSQLSSHASAVCRLLLRLWLLL